MTSIHYFSILKLKHQKGATNLRRYNKKAAIFVTAFFITLFLALGFWQLYRLNWKNNLIEEINSSLMNNPVKFESQKIKNFQKIKFKGKLGFFGKQNLLSL